MDKGYRKAAEQGLANAQFNLGVMYHKGRGVPQSYEEAAKWFRKAAEQGDTKAIQALGKVTGTPWKTLKTPSNQNR